MNIIRIANYYYNFDKTLHSSNKGVTIMLYKKINLNIKINSYILFTCDENFKPYREIIIKKNTLTNGNNELKYLLKFKDNKSFIKYLGHYKTEFNVYIITKYYKNGSLSNNIYRFNSDLLLEILYNKIKLILDYLDDLGINHGDIKETNILLNNKMEPIINDLESMHNKYKQSKIITKQYVMPGNMNLNKDIWALFVMIYHIKYKKYPDIKNIIKTNLIENNIINNIFVENVTVLA